MSIHNKYKKGDFELIEENEDPSKAVIRRKNIVSEFTLSDVDANIKNFEKLKKEAESQIKLSIGFTSNIERNHPWVLDMDEEKRHHVAMFHEHDTTAKETAKKLEEIEEALAEYVKFKKTIAEATGLPVDKKQKDGGKDIPEGS